MEMYLTHYRIKKEKIHSEYGIITWHEWCLREQRRINKCGGNVEVHERNNVCALYDFKCPKLEGVYASIFKTDNIPDI